MFVDGTFDEVVVNNVDEEGREWSFNYVEFEQDGFTFTCYFDPDAHPILCRGSDVRGYIDDTVVARGYVEEISPRTFEGRECLRTLVHPPTMNTAPINHLE